MKRAAAVATVALFATTASANGAMGLALEMFEYRTWAVYVVVILVLEAWLIGRWIGLSWLKSAVLTLAANGLTAFVCPSCLVVFLHHPFVGTAANPNPFWNAVVLLTVFGVISACIEALFWKRPANRLGKEGVFARTVWVHLVSVPIALAILLIPERPYVGLEAITRLNRSFYLREALRFDTWAVRGRIPSMHSAEELLLSFPPPSWQRNPEDAWTAAYDPVYSRFDTSERRRNPYELNPEVAGKKLEDLHPPVWILRVRRRGEPYGWYIGPEGLRSTSDPSRLGWGKRLPLPKDEVGNRGRDAGNVPFVEDFAKPGSR